jgi:hypothetical protein
MLGPVGRIDEDLDDECHAEQFVRGNRRRVTFMDLGVHMVAIALVASLAAVAEGVAQRRAQAA